MRSSLQLTERPATDRLERQRTAPLTLLARPRHLLVPGLTLAEHHPDDPAVSEPRVDATIVVEDKRLRPFETGRVALVMGVVMMGVVW